jgi:hypothetical protein
MLQRAAAAIRAARVGRLHRSREGRAAGRDQRRDGLAYIVAAGAACETAARGHQTNRTKHRVRRRPVRVSQVRRSPSLLQLYP